MKRRWLLRECTKKSMRDVQWCVIIVGKQCTAQPCLERGGVVSASSASFHTLGNRHDRHYTAIMTLTSAPVQSRLHKQDGLLL